MVKSCKFQIVVFIAFAFLILMGRASPVPGSENLGAEGAKSAGDAIDSAKEVGKTACSVGAELAAVPGKAMADGAGQAFTVIG